MTLQEVKEHVAETLGYESWSRIHPHYHEHYFNEVAELYARSKWDEACGAQRFYVQEYLSMRRHNVFVDNIAKPEFKP